MTDSFLYNIEGAPMNSAEASCCEQTRRVTKLISFSYTRRLQTQPLSVLDFYSKLPFL